MRTRMTNSRDSKMILPRVSHYGKQRTPYREHLVPVPMTLAGQTEFLVSDISFSGLSSKGV